MEFLSDISQFILLAQETAEQGGGGEEDSGGSFLVSPNVGLMIWTLLVFGISMYVLAKLAFPRIAEALDRRQKAIEDSIDAAERTRKEVADLTVLATEKVTRKTLTDEDHKRLVEDALEEVDFSTLAGEASNGGGAR